MPFRSLCIQTKLMSNTGFSNVSSFAISYITDKNPEIHLISGFFLYCLVFVIVFLHFVIIIFLIYKNVIDNSVVYLVIIIFDVI